MGFELDNCLGCIKLRTGSLIIGYLYLFLQVCTIIMCCIVFGKVTCIKYEHDYDKDQNDAVTGILKIFSILFIVEIFWIFNTILLLVGVHKNKHELVEQYLRDTAYYLITLYIAIIVMAAFSSTTLQYLTFELYYAALTTYFFIVIKSHHCRMEGEDQKIPATF